MTHSGRRLRLILPNLYGCSALVSLSIGDHTIQERPPRGQTALPRTLGLVVDDDDQVRWFALAALTQEGWTVLQAADGEKGLELIKQLGGEIDFLLTDLESPKMNGLALAVSTRMLCPACRIIIMSGHAAGQLPQGAADAFLAKPFSAAKLCQTVTSCLKPE
ncbi:MAG: hypothetical protein C5B51_28165 [Terriglobia bacterium]|nr:MAG: hypothetical protein C5B51_28165 [Terriglobia bacterium]